MVTREGKDVQAMYPANYKDCKGPKKASAHLSHSHLKMKSALLLLALAAVSTASPEDIYKKFLRSMDVYNFRMKCWGEKNVVKLSVGIEMAKKKCMQQLLSSR